MVLEIDISGANEDVDARALDPIRDGHDRRHREWRDVVSDSFDCFFEDHPFARKGDAILSALTLAENMRYTGALRFVASTRGCGLHPTGGLVTCLAPGWAVSEWHRVSRGGCTTDPVVC